MEFIKKRAIFSPCQTYRYSLTRIWNVKKKPVLFIDTPRKIKNIDYDKIGIDSFEFYARELVGEFFDPKKKYDLENINTVDDDQTNKIIFSVGKSAEVACTYISKLMKQ